MTNTGTWSVKIGCKHWNQSQRTRLLPMINECLRSQYILIIATHVHNSKHRTSLWLSFLLLFNINNTGIVAAIIATYMFCRIIIIIIINDTISIIIIIITLIIISSSSSSSMVSTIIISNMYNFGYPFKSTYFFSPINCFKHRELLMYLSCNSVLYILCYAKYLASLHKGPLVAQTFKIRVCKKMKIILSVTLKCDSYQRQHAA